MMGLIEVVELDGSHRRLLFSSNLSKPMAIVLDPLSRLVVVIIAVLSQHRTSLLGTFPWVNINHIV